AGSHIEVGDVFLFPADHRRRLALTAFSASEWMGRAGKVYGIDAAASFLGVHSRTIYRKLKKLLRKGHR
uniref:hypothetical protein n=1 Tax=Haliangium sp. TaxID=2663208 RepID=UPI003D0A3B1B